jgi:phenylacetate-CoA ligase
MAFLDPVLETAPRDKLEKIQWQKLKRLLEIVFEKNPFYQRKFENYNVKLADIKNLSDLTKLPFTTKLEFQEDQEQHPPFGTNLSEPLENYVQYHQTTGTTGKPLKWLDTAESWQWRARCIAHVFRAAGLGPGDIFMLPFNFGPYTAFWGAYEAAQYLGILTIPTGGWDTKQRLRCLLENKVTAIATTPTYARRMAEVAEEEGIELRKSSVRAILLAGEPGGMIPSIRKKIEEAWGAEVYEYPGLTEVGTYAFTCEYSKETMSLHVIESEFIVEVIDPETGEVVPEGTIGELVITNLGRSCSPAIRFHTEDLVKLKRGICPCGRTFVMLEGGVLGRRDDMLLVRGVNVYPSAIANIIEALLPPGQEYQIICYSDPEGRDAVKVQIELAPGQENLQQLIAEEIKLRLNLRLEVEAVPIGKLPRAEYKSKKVLDLRAKVQKV